MERIGKNVNSALETTNAPIRNIESYLGHRIVLTCLSKLSFCGIAQRLIDVDKKCGILIETDQNSGFSIWCPLDFVKSITIIPIPIDDN